MICSVILPWCLLRCTCPCTQRRHEEELVDAATLNLYKSIVGHKHHKLVYDMWFLVMLFLFDNFDTLKVDHILAKVADFDGNFDTYNNAEQTRVMRNEVILPVLVKQQNLALHQFSVCRREQTKCHLPCEWG